MRKERTRTLSCRVRALTHRREAEHDVQVLARAAQEVLVQVLVGRRPTRELFLHDRDQLALDLVHLVASEQVRNLSARAFDIATQIDVHVRHES